jgi:hypothetical protein
MMHPVMVTRLVEDIRREDKRTNGRMDNMNMVAQSYRAPATGPGLIDASTRFLANAMRRTRTYVKGTPVRTA